MGDILFEQVFKGGTNVLGDKLQYFHTEKPELERWIVTLPPLSCGEWHIHLVPEFFYVESGTLYVVNELEDQTLAVTTFAKGEHGLTDCKVPQFIWNPDKTSTVKVTAIYIGCFGVPPTRKLGKKPDQALLNRLFNKSAKNNASEESNFAKRSMA